MRTGRYRVRKGWFGKAILQAEYESSSKVFKWADIHYNYAPSELKATT